MDNEIVFVTHNTGKIKSAEKYFKKLKFTTYNYELDEPRSDDIKEIARSKVMQAYKMLNRPCIALDTDFRIDELNGFSRAFVNFSFETIGIDGILKLMESKENRCCAFNEEERENRRTIDGSYSAMEKFAEWYEKEPQ